MLPSQFASVEFSLTTMDSSSALECTPFGCEGSPPTESFPPRGFVWVDASCGQVPPDAFVGGQDCCGTPVYVVRACHECTWIPGKLVSCQDCAYVLWRGVEHRKTQYQVLVGGLYNWVWTNGSNIPPGAFPGGESEDGEPLFVGRVRHEGRIITGKVQMSEGVCYISFNGKELTSSVYEILMPDEPSVCTEPGSFKWVEDSCGQVPPGAVVGGQDCHKKPVYVVRAHHKCAMIPGMLFPCHDSAFVPWGGETHAKDKYEVLVGGPSNWVWANGSNIPPGAFPGAGISENGESLFVGRVHYKGNIIPGKVQPSQGVCYIAFGGKERAFRVYEILMSACPLVPITFRD